jgi:hypothetical protein
MPELRECCGHVHEGGCDQPVTEPPPGLFDASGELTRLGAVVEDAANYLAMRGYLDPDAEEWLDWVLAELADVHQAGPCPTCHKPLDGSDLADHFLARKQNEPSRSVRRAHTSQGTLTESYFAGQRRRVLRGLCGRRVRVSAVHLVSELVRTGRV